jgi:acyl-CoA thioester hydrolase
VSRPEPERADAYRYFVPITTRWMDNDAYGHVNNVTFYSWFDTAANHFLVREGGLDIQASAVIGLVVESQCHYHAPVAYPEAIRAGVRVDKLGNRSVTYGIAVFREGEEVAVAHGHFVHVFVDRATRRPAEIPAAMRVALERIRRT